MLKDILNNTQYVCEQFIPHNIVVQEPLSIYKTYTALKRVIENIQLVSEHYLALELSETFLQNSSFGSPENKWRFFLNKDLECLNDSVKSYLKHLGTIAPADESGFSESYLYQKYNCKYFYGFVNSDYSVGYLDGCSAVLKMKHLKIDVLNNDTSIIFEYKKIDLTTFEARVALQDELRALKSKLDKYRERFKNYILSNYMLEDML